MKIEKVKGGYALRENSGAMCILDRNHNGAEAWACSAIDQLLETAECLQAEIERLTTAGLEADWLRQDAAILRDCCTFGGKWDEDDQETKAYYDQMLALADRLTPQASVA